MNDNGNSLPCALQLLFHGMEYTDIAAALYEALGEEPATRVFWRLSDHLPLNIMGVLDKEWFYDRLEAEEKRYIGTDEHLHDVIRSLSQDYIGECMSAEMDGLIDMLTHDGLIEPIPQEVNNEQ